MSRKFILVLAALVVCLPAAHAQKLYKWVDRDGNVSYHDRPPSDASKYHVEEKRVRGSSNERNDELEAIAGKFPVLLYSTPRCSACDLARVYLGKRKVPFTEKNVGDDRAVQEELIKRTGQLTVPTIVVGERVMNGYMETLLGGELDQAGYPKIDAAEQPGEQEEAKAQ